MVVLRINIGDAKRKVFLTMQTGEYMPQVQERPTLTIGEGTINPDVRVSKGEITEVEIEDFCTQLENDTFIEEISPETTPDSCVDGRGFEIGGNAAGGTFTLVMADALTSQSFRNPGETAPTHASRFFTELLAQEKPVPVRGHTGRADAENSGCGAEDKLDTQIENAPTILGYMTRRGDEIRDVLTGLGIDISDDLHSKIVTNAQNLRDENYATNGKDLENVTKKVAGEDAAPMLEGEHLEAVLDIETRPGKTMNRQKIHNAFDGRLQAFHLDVWAVANGTKLFAASEEEAHERLVAALYYNVATACTLASNVRIVAH
jgi:hypothetical protein